MIVALHVIIALASVVYSTYLFAAPSKSKLRGSYVLIAATLTSGFYLVWSTRTNIVQACLVGLMYIGALSLVTEAARHRLARKGNTTQAD